MEFLDIKLTKVLSLLLRELFTVPSTGEFYRKPYSSLVLKNLTEKSAKQEISSLFIHEKNGKMREGTRQRLESEKARVYA
jgi:hypothetical protein